MRLAVTPTELDIAIGEPVVLQLEIYNSRPVIDGYQASLLGLGDQAFTADPPELSLFPETGGVMVLTFALPSGFPAGPRVIGVKAASVTDPRVSAVEEIQISVAAVSVATLAVEPLMVTAGNEAEFALSLDNRGNVPLESRLVAVDSTGKLEFQVEPAGLAAGPGETGLARVVVSGRRPFFGSPIPHQLTFTAETAAEPLTATATFLQKPRIPRAALTLLSILAAIALWGAVLLLGVNKAIDRVAGGDDDKEAAAAVTAGPISGGKLGSVAGKVSARPDGGGAIVTLLPLPSGEEGAAPPPEAPEPVTTGPTGEFLFQEVAAPGTYQIVFAKAGFGTQSRLIELKLGEALAGVDVTLVSGTGAISGLVSDGNGPLGAVSVMASNGTDTITTLSSPSGPVGSYSLDGLPTPGTYLLAFSKAAFGTQTTVIDLAAGQKLTGQNIELTKGRGSVSGTVLSQTGEPVADVLVTVTAGAGTVPPIVVVGPSTTTTTPVEETTTTVPGPPAKILGSTMSLNEGPVGYFSVSGLPTPGTFTVTFQKQGFLVKTATVALAENGNETGLSPLLQPSTGSVSGVVTEDIRRAPACEPGQCLLPGVNVRVTDRNGAEVRATVSANSPPESLGRYEIAGLQAGTYNVTFSKTGYVPQTFSLTLTDNQQNPLDVNLKGEPGVITGTAPNCTAVALLFRNNAALDP
ncbi:MAG: carboxypeptidase-like regulatory domain-containing protein, partial [Actinobacteria bacterium]|nr:carboxypeptidase-like regulatory domain-containing protein [Actinomycetota bacterium]